jgi:hypothetical protein
MRKTVSIIIALVGVACLITGGILFLLGLSGGGIIFVIIGIVMLLVSIFRRFGRPGDFERSGWTGS